MNGWCSGFDGNVVVDIGERIEIGEFARRGELVDVGFSQIPVTITRSAVTDIDYFVISFLVTPLLIARYALILFDPNIFVIEIQVTDSHSFQRMLKLNGQCQRRAVVGFGQRVDCGRQDGGFLQGQGRIEAVSGDNFA